MNVAELDYRVLGKSDLTPEMRASIADVNRKSLAIDFDRKYAPWIEGFVKRAGRSLRRPNTSEGVPGLRTRAYARPLSVVAMKGSEVVAHLPTAHNVSSGWPVGLREVGIQFKLHFDRYIGSKYAWLGYAGINESVREIITPGSDEVNPLDVMVAMALERYDKQQKVSAFPWGPEETWRAELDSIGMQRQPVGDTDVTSLGPIPVQQQWWLGKLPDVQEAIMAKVGAEEVLAAVRHG